VLTTLFVSAALLLSGPASTTQPVGAPFTQVDGHVLLTCGTDPFSNDIFELNAGSLTRRTESPPGEGIVMFSATEDRIAFVRTGGFGGDRIELAARRGALYRGRAFADSDSTGAADESPALAADGAVAWTSVVERSNGYLGDAIYTRSPGERRRRIATYAYVWEQRYVGRRLFAETSSHGQHYEVRDAGTRRSRTTRLNKPQRLAWSRSGRLAYSSGRKGALRIRSYSTGRRHAKSYPSEFLPLAWSPDERSILLGSERGLALLDPATGTTTELGTLPCGFVSTAQWING
jgi:hypothetical protein